MDSQTRLIGSLDRATGWVWLVGVFGAVFLVHSPIKAALQSDPAGEPRPPAILRVEVGLKSGASGTYKIGTWTPVRATIEASSRPFSGTIEFVAPDDDGMPAIVRSPLELQANERQTALGYVRPGLSNASIVVRMVDAVGKRVGLPRSVLPVEELGWSTLLIATFGNTPGLEKMPELPKYLESDGKTRGLAVAEISELPGDLIGLDSVCAIALSTSDPRALSHIRGRGIDVLRAWVEQGGHLVVSLGENWQETLEVLGDLLPAEPIGMARLTDVGAIETFAGTVSPIHSGLFVARLKNRVDATTAILAATPETPVIVRGAYGFGLITLTGVDVAAPPFSDWGDRTIFWDKLLNIRGHSKESSMLVSGPRGALIQSANPDLASRLHQALEVFPGVTLVPFGWVAFLILVYLILIGPIDYLFLRKVARRMEWTWITFPSIVIASSLGAFALAFALKGASLRVNKLDLLDVDQTRGTVRGSSWMTLYSPANRDYDLAIEPSAPDFRKETAWRVAVDRSISWFAPEQPALVGVGLVAVGNRASHYAPDGHVERLEGVRIPVWSTRSFVGRWSGEAGGVRLAEADLRGVAGDRAAGSIRNLLDRPMRNARLYYGRYVYDLGTIRSRGIARVDHARAEAITRQLSRLLFEADRQLKDSTQPEGLRNKTEMPIQSGADLLRAALFHDALGTRATAYPSIPLRGFDLTTQVVELRRPMLVAEVDAPATSLTLRGRPNQARVDQTTIVRAILKMTD